MTDLPPTIIPAILNISRKLTEARPLNELLTTMLDDTLTVFNAERGLVVLIGEQEPFDYRVARRQGGSDLAYPRDEISRTVLQRVLETAQPLILANALEDPSFADATSVVTLQLRSIACVPLVARSAVIGALYLEDRRAAHRFQPDIAVPLVLFANQIAGLIEINRMNETLEKRIHERTVRLERALAQLEEMWSEAVDANRLRTVMLTRITNDLRNPLTIIINAISLLKEGAMGEINPDQNQWLGEALTAAQRILSLSDEMFNLTRIEIRGVTLQLEAVPVRKLLGQAFQAAQAMSWPPDVKFELDVDGDLPEVTVDSGRIHQVLVNMIAFGHERTRSGSVILHAVAHPRRGIVEIGVADSGPPIHDASLTSIFSRYAPEDMETATPMTLLGMAISNQLVELHGGKIWAETAVGGGLNVVFTLPYISG